MRIVITGATSFVGAAAIQELLENGHEVYAVVRPSSRKLETLTGQEAGKNALREGRLHIVENDLSAPELLTEKIQGSCDAFCHFGWGGSGSGARTGEQLQEENLRASLDTVRAAKALGCRRFLFSGSQAEYGMHQTRMTEETECAPRSAYGEAKLRMRRPQDLQCLRSWRPSVDAGGILPGRLYWKCGPFSGGLHPEMEFYLHYRSGKGGAGAFGDAGSGL